MNAHTKETHRSRPWWKAEANEADGSADLHQTVLHAATHLEEQQRNIDDAYTQFLSLYTGRALTTPYDFYDTYTKKKKIRLNVTKSACDAVNALIGANRPRPQVLSIGGDHELREKAENLTRFVNGEFHEQNQWETGLEVFASAAITGSGWETIRIANRKMKYEFIPSHQMMFDRAALQLPHPRWHIRKQQVPKDLLHDEYEDRFTKVIDASSLNDEGGGTMFEDSLEEYVTKYTATYLPGSGKGRIVEFTSAGILSDTKTWFDPCSQFKWNGIPGFALGQGAVEELQSIQVEVDELAQKIQELMTLATSIVLKRRGTNMRRVTNQAWRGYEYSGDKPEFLNIVSVSTEYFTQLDRLYARAFELVGVSMMHAQGSKPPGVESAAGLRTLNDVGTKRFAHTAQRWESFYMRHARNTIETARLMLKRGIDIETLVGDDDELKMLKFSDCAIDKLKYKLRIRPTSILPDEPAGKIEMMKSFAEIAKSADPNVGTHIISMMSGVPDLEALVKEYNAPREIAEKMVSHILQGNEAEPPFREMDLVQARMIATRQMMLAVSEKVPEPRIIKLRNWVKQVDDLLDKVAAAQAPAPGAPGQPPGPPMPGAGGPPQLPPPSGAPNL